MKSASSDTIVQRCPIAIIRRAVSSDLTVPSAGAAVVFESAGHRILFSERIEDIPADWEAVIAGRNLFLERTYLQVLEEAPPKDMGFGYLLFYQEHRPVGVAVLQFLDFKADQAIRDRRLRAGKGLANRLKDAVARKMRLRILICGNVLLTGQHGFFFEEGRFSTADSEDLLIEGIRRVHRHLAGQGRPVAATLIKDLPAAEAGPSVSLTRAGFSRLQFEPSMILSLRPEWATFDDYLESMTSKYRVRARRAFKKVDSISRRELHFPEVCLYQDQLAGYYNELADGADFNLVWLSPDYFRTLKEQFPDRFRLHGYFEGEHLIGFCTTLHNGEELEAHFLGFDAAGNRKHQLYLNMLYDMVWEGISAGVQRVIFSRTALEIKSSVGARPRDMDLYVRAENSLFNRVVPGLIRYLQPTTDWTPRHPFGEPEG